MKTAMFPSVILAKKIALEQMKFYLKMMNTRVETKK